MLRGLWKRLRGDRQPQELLGSQSATINETINNPYWAYATAADADNATSPTERDKLRRRARLEVRNNCYLRGILSTLCDDLIGCGPALQILTDGQGRTTAAGNRIETLWTEWAASQRLTAKLRTLKWHKVVDGEGFAVLETDPSREPITLSVGLYEPERFATPWTQPYPERQYIYDGIEFDRADNPTRYWRLGYHPGGTYRTLAAEDFDVIPADLVLHWYDRHRASQHRGHSELESVLDLCVDLRAYRDAAVSAARTAASISLALYTDMPPGESADLGDDPLKTVPIPRDSIVNMPDGWRADTIRAEQPTTTYAEFVKSLITEIARAFKMPYSVAAGTSEDQNYASGRLDLQHYQRALEVERDAIQRTLLEPILAAWLQDMRLAGALPRIGAFGWRWIWPGWPHVDPQKEADAAIALFNAGLLDERKYWAERYGLAPDQAYEQLAQSIEIRRELGLPLPAALVTAMGYTPREGSENEPADTTDG